MGYQLIETIEVGSGGAASIEFTSIPQDGVDLVLKFSFRFPVASVQETVIVWLNGDFSSNFSQIRLLGNGSTASSQTATNGYIEYVNANSSTANTFSSSEIYISNYTSAGTKSLSYESVAENNATTAYQSISAASKSSVGAITALKLGRLSDLLFQYSTASLYKITAD